MSMKLEITRVTVPSGEKSGTASTSIQRREPRLRVR